MTSQGGLWQKLFEYLGADGLRVLDRDLLRLLSFLTRRQAWMSPPEISRTFRPDGRGVSERTLYRWFSILEEQLGLAYFPYPRMNLLGLADVHVRLKGVRSPAVMAAIPWGRSSWVEIGLDGRPFLSEDYWIPGPALKSFREYWSAAKDLGLVSEVELLAVRNPHFFFSPFHEVVDEEGWVEIPGEMDNSYFVDLFRRHLEEPYAIRVGDWVKASPLVVPLVLEHLWRHCSSRQVWHAIRAKGDAHILRHAKGSLAKALLKKGHALQVLQRQWDDLVRHFNDVFLQPVVLLPLGLLRNSLIVTFTLRPESDEATVELARRVSGRSVVTVVMPEEGPEGRCRMWCTPPSEYVPAILRLIGEHHRGAKPPFVGIVDLNATRRATQPSFLGFDWQTFDAETFTWAFRGEAYIESLKGLKPDQR